MKIVLVAGMPGAGKEELLTVARSMDIPFLRMGDIVRDHYTINDIAFTRMSVGEHANNERKLHGKNIWAQRAIENMSGDLFLVDGCRSMDEVISYRELSDDVVIIGIFTSPAVRYDRLVKRAREDAPRNITEFNERDSRELSWGLGSVIAQADEMIVNMGTLEEFKESAEKVLKGLR